MKKNRRGYWEVEVEGVEAGASYRFCFDGKERPDPASALQPQGVHGPSEVVDHGAFAWSDGAWGGICLEESVIYELHVGTFSSEGTFAAVIPRLAELRALGITAIELMPVAQFPGERNWGYDGVGLFAVATSYGTPEDLRRLVDACHREGLGVILDVVYNHLGPEGNYLRDFGPYFTDRYRTPWGEAVNLDGEESDEVRSFFVENALFWFRYYHFDALRLDAIHALYDFSARPFLEELAGRTRDFSASWPWDCLLIAESDLNDPRVVRPPEVGGYGLDGQWSDDFHHALHCLLTEETGGYYADYGRVGDLVKAYREGFVISGSYSSFRRRRHGRSSADLPASRLVVCAQNHDQVGNRKAGERLITMAGYEGAKAAAGALLLSPFVPLLFMGEEYGEEAPFLYFVDFADEELIESVREGRKEEFPDFASTEEHPDPQAPETFFRAKLHWGKRKDGGGGALLGFYGALLRHRKTIPALAAGGELECWGEEEKRFLWLRRSRGESEAAILLNFNKERLFLEFPSLPGRWRKILDSAEPCWLGPGATLPEEAREKQKLEAPPLSCALYQRR